MAENAYGTMMVSYATADEARKLAGTSPWACRWRTRADGAVELIRRQDSRYALLVVREGAPAELVAESLPQSRISRWLKVGGGGLAAFFCIFRVAAWAWLAVPVVLGIVACLVGWKLDRRPNRDVWVEEQRGAGAQWTTVPREVGAPMSTGNQLIAASAIADAHGTHAVFRDPGDGTVEVVVRVDKQGRLHHLDRLGRELAVRDVPLRWLSVRQVQRSVDPPSTWETIRTNVSD